MIISSGEGKYRVWLNDYSIGLDHLLILTGGEKHHIGGIVLCAPNQESQVIRLGSHYDYQVLKPLAEKACLHLKKTVVAIGGIHIDNATKKEITLLINNCNELIKSFIKTY